MTKSNKTTTKVAPKKDRDLKNKALGIYSLVVALAELASAYVFVTQDNRVLLPLAIILGYDAAQRFARAFVK